MSRRTYRGDNFLGLMTPLFCLVFAAVIVLVIWSALFDPLGPPWWFALLWSAWAGFMVWVSGYWLATKIKLVDNQVRWSYLLRRGGSRDVQEILSVGSYGYWLPGWIEFVDEQKVWIIVTFRFRRFARVLGQAAPSASIEV